MAKDVKAFRNTLAGYKQPLKIEWRTYVPDPDDDTNEINPALRICHRLVKEATAITKVFIPSKVLYKLNNFILAEGNHDLIANGVIREGLDLGSIHLAHIPVRSPGQYGAKVAISRLQYIAKSELNEDTGWHFKSPFELLKNDPQTFFDTYRAAALRYAVKPESNFTPEMMFDPIIYRGEPLRYTKANSSNWKTLQSLIKYAETLARAYADLSPKHEETMRKPEKIRLRFPKRKCRGKER